MIVTYLKTNSNTAKCPFHLSIPGFPPYEDRDGALWVEMAGRWMPMLNDLTKAGYRLYPDQEIQRKYNEEGVEVPQTIGELNLRDFTVEEQGKLAAPEELRKAKAKLDEFLALPASEWTQAKAIECIKFQLRVLERIVRYLV